MPTLPGPTSEPLTPQQTLDKVAGLITEVGEESPVSPETPEPAPAPTPPATPPAAETEPPASEEPDDTAIEVVVDGETETVPLSELKKGYSRQADYTRKTQALARERESLRQTLEAEAQSAVQADRQQYLQSIQAFREALEQLSGEPDWLALKGQLSDADFLKQRADWEAQKVQRLRLKTEEDRVAQLHQAEAIKAQQGFIRAEQDKLKAAWPEWADAEKAKAEGLKLVAAAKAYGFTEQEAASVTDHRTVLLLRDAMRYRELHRDPAPKVSKAAIRTAKPGTPERPRPNADFQKKLDRVQKSGRQRDAMDAIADLID